MLDRLSLAPFDVAKLVHPFQAAAPSLPPELNRHLFLLEERILEVPAQALSALHHYSACLEALAAAGATGTCSCWRRECAPAPESSSQPRLAS